MSQDIAADVDEPLKRINEVGIILLKNIRYLARRKVSRNFIDKGSWLEVRGPPFSGELFVDSIRNIDRAIEAGDISKIKIKFVGDHPTPKSFEDIEQKLKIVDYLKREVNACMDKIQPWLDATTFS